MVATEEWQVLRGSSLDWWVQNQDRRFLKKRSRSDVNSGFARFGLFCWSKYSFLLGVLLSVVFLWGEGGSIVCCHFISKFDIIRPQFFIWPSLLPLNFVVLQFFLWYSGFLVLNCSTEIFFPLISFFEQVKGNLALPKSQWIAIIQNQSDIPLDCMKLEI